MVWINSQIKSSSNWLPQACPRLTCVHSLVLLARDWWFPHPSGRVDNVEFLWTFAGGLGPFLGQPQDGSVPYSEARSPLSGSFQAWKNTLAFNSAREHEELAGAAITLPNM